MIEPRKTAGMIQKYRAEKAMLWTSTLMKTVSLEAFSPAADEVRKTAIPTAPMKKAWATMIGRNFVERSAASARPVRRIADARRSLSSEFTRLWQDQ